MSNSITILHVEDEPGFAEVTSEFLKRVDERFDIHIASNANDGEEILDTLDIDCIVSDHDLPSRNGLEFLKSVRETHPDLPFILFTGKGSEEVASKAITAGVTDYLQKENGTDQYTILANRIKNAVELHYAEEEAERTLTQLEAISANSADAIVIIDADSRIHFTNHAISEFFGYTPSELEDEQLTTIIPGHLRERHLDALEPDIETGERPGSWSNIEFTGLHKDGTEVPLSISYGEFHQDGETRFVGIMRDITEQKQREQKLREKQAELRKYELTVENSIDLLAACDADYDLLFANEQYQDYYGIVPTDISQTSLPALLGDEWEPTVKDHVDRSLVGDIVQYEMQRARSNGDVRTLDIRYYPLQENDGSIIGTVAAMRDITSTWEKNREREQIIEHVTDAIVEVDENWRFTLVNEQAEERYDMSEEYLLGRDFWDVFPEAQGTRFEEEYRTVMKTREPTSFVEYFSQLDGWFEFKAYPEDDGGLAFYFIEVTEEREHQIELKEMKERLDLALSVTQTGIWEWDLETDKVTWDKTLEQSVGSALGEFEETVEAFEQRIHPDDRSKVETAIEQAVANDEMFDTTFRMIYKDDGMIWADVRGRVVGDGDEGDRMIGVHHDVTDQKEREQQLRRQQAFIEESLDAIQDIFFVINDDGELIRWNASVPDVSGYSDEEIREMELTEFFVEGHRGRIQTNIQEVFETGSSTVQADVITKAGERMQFEFMGTRLQNPISEGVVVCGIGRDISERVERERELHKQANRFHGVLENVEAAIWIRDRESRFKLVNQNFRELFDIDASVEIKGCNPSDILPKHVAVQFRENDQRVLNQEERVEFEEAVETANGTRTFLTQIAPLYDDDDELFATCGVATDITDLKQTQAELERINEQLDEVVSVIAHDLRNPLNVVAGRLEFIRDEYDGEHLESITHALDRMEALIEDILLLARQGKRVGEKETINLNDLVVDCWGVIETGDTSLDIETEQTVQADASRLQQLLENLMRNAIEHAGPGITVTVGDLEDGFFVEDTGPGIPPADRDEVFEAGFSTSSDGTGFGLNIVKQIADAHGWTLQVTEASSGGARFEITGVKFTP